MARPQLKQMLDETRPAIPLSRGPRLASGDDAPVPSPAARLQQSLQGAAIVSEPKWSPRMVTLAVLTFCGGFWILVGALVYWAIQALSS